MAFDAVAYINEPRWRHTSLGLGRIGLLLEKLGRPQDAFASVHVAGTNGKGSTCAYLASILEAAGRRTGLFTSPYVERFEERIQVDGRMICPEALERATLRVREAACAVEAETGEHPTEFELMCAVAFVHFAQAQVDVAVVECGLGGRLDATNVVEPALCVITRIGMDHTDVLGETLSAIAGEKAGIVKPGVPVVTCPQEEEALAVIRRRCEEARSPLRVTSAADLRVEPLSLPLCAATRRRFSYQGRAFETGMLASYQPANAALAIEAARTLAAARPALGIDARAIGDGVARATWPGRFEVVGRRPLVVVDGAHNPQGAAALAASLEAIGADAAQAALVVGVLADKDAEGILAPLLPFASRVDAYAPDNPRALDAGSLAEKARSLARAQGRALEACAHQSAADALWHAVQKEGPEGLVVAFGSLYSIGALKRACATPPWG